VNLMRIFQLHSFVTFLTIILISLFVNNRRQQFDRSPSTRDWPIAICHKT
jgi:hypothetical protein